MATRVMVTSAEGGSGKSTIAAGLLEALKGSVGSVGVFRPIGRGGVDYVLDMLRSHAGSSADGGAGVDYGDVHANRDAALARILEGCSEAERGHDAVLIIGSDYTDVGTPTEFSMNARVAATLAASVVLVLNARNPDGSPRAADQIAEIGITGMAELRAEHAHVVAFVVNRVDPDDLDIVASAVRERCGLPAWCVPDDAGLTAPLLGAVLAATEAELVRGQQELLERPVSGTVIAAMTLENVLPRLQEGAVVIVPGDRVDVIVGSVVAHSSATFPTVAGVILNGGFDLSEPVIRLLDGLGASVPIARTRLGTFDTAIRATRAHSRLAADSPARHARAVGLVERHVDLAELIRLLSIEVHPTMTPLRFEQTLVERARAHRRRIVLPEADDDRILRAAAMVLQREIADITLLGDEVRVRSRAAELGLDIAAAAVVSPHDPELVARFAAEYRDLRAHKGVSLERAAELVTDVAYFGTMMVLLGLSDGMVSGATHTTAHTIRPAFEVVKTRPGVSAVSSVFLMALADRVLVYGDCAVIPEPTVEQLADIAVSSSATARLFGIEPRVAMLSYSTGESGTGSEVDRVRAATALVRQRAPELPVAGPIQYDAAADPEVGDAKLPGSDVAGRATVFVFPDLDAGNTTYKAVQRSAGAVAVGPILQGLAKPINDLSRGALVRDIVNTIAITAIQAQSDGPA